MRAFVGSLKWCRPARETETAGLIRYVDAAGAISAEEIRACIKRDVEYFITSGDAAAGLVLHAPTDPEAEDADAARDRAIRILEEALCIAYEEMYYQKTRDEIRSAIQERIIGPTSERRGEFDLQGSEFIPVAMAPQYPKDHPRHAPELLVVLTWRSTAQRYVEQHSDYAVNLREASNKVHGSPYNGNHFWLEVPKQAVL